MGEVYQFTVEVLVEAPTRSAEKVLWTVQEVLDEHTHVVQPAGVLEFKEARAVGVIRRRAVPPRRWVVKRDACYLDSLGANTFELWRAISFDNLRRARNWAKQWHHTRVVRIVPKSSQPSSKEEKT